MNIGYNILCIQNCPSCGRAPNPPVSAGLPAIKWSGSRLWWRLEECLAKRIPQRSSVITLSYNFEEYQMIAVRPRLAWYLSAICSQLTGLPKRARNTKPPCPVHIPALRALDPTLKRISVPNGFLIQINQQPSSIRHQSMWNMILFFHKDWFWRLSGSVLAVVMQSEGLQHGWNLTCGNLVRQDSEFSSLPIPQWCLWFFLSFTILIRTLF